MTPANTNSISDQYNLGHTEQIQSLVANKSESRTHTNLSGDWADMLFLGKCVEWFWFWSEGASSELCHKPQCLGLGKFERWWYVRKFPPHHGQPAICLHPANSHITTISVIKYLCEICTFVRYLSINIKAKKRYLRICRLGRIHPQDSWLNNDSGKDKNLICTNKILICLYFTSNHSGKQPAYCQQEYLDKQPSFVTQNNSRNLDSKDGAVVQSGYHRYAECGRGGVNWGVVHNSVLLSAPEQFYPHSINCPPYSCPQLCAAVRLFRHQRLRHHPPQHLCYRIMCLFLHQYGHLAEQSCWKNCMWWSLSCYIVGSTTGEIPAILACTSGSSYKVLALPRC